MTLQVKILLSYLALGGGAGGIYLGANGGFGNSATEGIVEISEPNSNPQLVVANPPVEEPTVPAEKPQNIEVPVTEEKEEIPVNAEITPEVETNEKAEEVLANDGKTEQTEISNSNEEAETKPVLELQTAEKAPAPQPKELKANIPSPTHEKAKESKGSASIKEAASKQPIPKTDQKVENPSLDAKETKARTGADSIKAPTTKKPAPRTVETIVKSSDPVEGELYGMPWIRQMAQGFAANRQEIAEKIKLLKASVQ